MGIDIASIVAASRQAFAAAGRGPKDLFEAAENVRDKGSPLGVTPKVFDGRVEWLIGRRGDDAKHRPHAAVGVLNRVDEISEIHRCDGEAA